MPRPSRAIIHIDMDAFFQSLSRCRSMRPNSTSPRTGKASRHRCRSPRTIRAKIRRETNLTASAGVSYNKFLVKLASDHRKPDGLFVIAPKIGPAFVEKLPIEKFHGVGPATTAKMNRLGIATGLDLRAQTLPFLQRR
jgi:nucleotidyltransferase/DNA polymerase involved in DNA repair